jgi:predicted transposase YbfD/YdcC
LKGGNIAVDGKTVRGSGSGGETAIHMVSAFATALGVVLGQEKVASKSNEITAIPELLKALHLKEALVTIDAMGCQKNIACQITDQGGDYLLAVKGNQPTLLQAIETEFIDQHQSETVDRHRQARKSHGRIVGQIASVLPAQGSVDLADWPKCKTIGLVDSLRKVGDKESTFERRYYISSRELTAEQLAAAVRGHWGIENRLHWVLDVSFSEDASTVRRDNAPQNLSLLKKIVLNLLRLDTSDTTKTSLRLKRKRAGWDDDMRTLREQVQSLLHWEPGTALRAPLARSTWSDALSSRHRRAVLQAAMAPLLGEARAVLPDRLAQFPALQGRPVYAMDGTYQSESAHYGRCTPRQGGEDNPKGHALLSFYDVRLGCPTDVHVDTRSRHETALLRDYDQSAQPMTRHKGALWLVDRAFIDAAFWDSRKKRLGMTLITRMKSSLCIESTEPLPVADVPTNEGVLKDLRITLRSSRQNWRLITFRSPRGHLVEFLTNEFKLEPGVIAFLYSRRWEEEKCFDTWKNDFSLAKA